MNAYNVQGAPSLGKLPGLPRRSNVSISEVNQYFAQSLAEKVVAPVSHTGVSTSSGTTFWASGRAANVEGLGLVYYQQGSTYYVQAFTYGDDTFQLRGSPQAPALSSVMFGGNTLRLADGSFLTAQRNTVGNSFCRVSVHPDTYAITQTTNFIQIPTSGVCVSGEAFTCSPTSNNFGYAANASQREPAWVVDGAEIILFGKIDIAATPWVAAFVFNDTGQLTRVHKLFTYTEQASTYQTRIHVRRVNAYYHLCVLNIGPSTAYTVLARYACCSADFMSDIAIVFGEVSWSNSSLAIDHLIMAADRKAVLFFVVNSSSAPFYMHTPFSRAYRLDDTGKPIVSANNQLPDIRFNESASSASHSVLNDLFSHTTFSSSEEGYVRVPTATTSNNASGAAGVGGYIALSLKHPSTVRNPSHIYRGAYKFKTLSDAHDDLLMRFYPQVAVNQVDDGISASTYANPMALLELSAGYWLGLAQIASTSFRLQLYKEHA